MKYEFGWAGPVHAEKAWEAIGDRFTTFRIIRSSERKGKRQLWRFLYQVGGRLNRTPQPDGDCVSAAMRDVLDVLQGVEIVSGDREEFKPIFSPYHYATGRVLIGKNQLRGGAGSVGSWQADAIKQFGCVPYESVIAAGIAYEKATTQAWGNDQKLKDGQSFRDFLDIGKLHICRDTARVSTVEEIGDAIDNGHPVTLAASFGYYMMPDRAGFHVPDPSNPWGHQMSLCGVDWERQYFEMPNQWGDVHGHLKDFDDGTDLPVGILRVRFSHMRQHLKAGAEAFAFSRFEGFPEQKFDFSNWA